MAWNLHPHWNAPLTPELWLEIATYGLAPEAAARVRAEHLAHLEDALAAGEAKRDVLREWGDPHRAGDTFRKAHLTTTDASLMHPGYALSAAGWRRAVLEEGELGRSGVFLLLPMLFSLLQALFSPGLAVVGALCLAFVVPTSRWLVIAGPQLGGAARVVAAWLLSGWGSAFLLTLAGVLWKPDYWGATLGPGLLLLFGLPWLWRLWAGLRALGKSPIR